MIEGIFQINQAFARIYSVALRWQLFSGLSLRCETRIRPGCRNLWLHRCPTHHPSYRHRSPAPRCPWHGRCLCSGKSSGSSSWDFSCAHGRRALHRGNKAKLRAFVGAYCASTSLKQLKVIRKQCPQIVPRKRSPCKYRAGRFPQADFWPGINFRLARDPDTKRSRQRRKRPFWPRQRH